MFFPKLNPSLFFLLPKPKEVVVLLPKPKEVVVLLPKPKEAFLFAFKT